MTVEYAIRARLSFRAVNCPGQPAYDPGLQRHHLLPRQLKSRTCFYRMFTAVGPDRLGFDDFRRNGMLLPGNDDAARRTALPLHRGPHRHYNAMVIERAGQIEARWSARRMSAPDHADEEALFRLALLQRALRRRLLDPPGRPLVLNRHDPLGSGFDFAHLDAMADALWAGTQAVAAASAAFAA